MELNKNKIQYRPDIDGLRAVAVLSVIVFHAFPRYLPGGFLGVDIFFVISGYLICGILIDNIDKKDTFFRTFYFKRIRRIFPALITVLLFNLFIAYFILLPAEYKLLSEHITGSSFFVINLLLMNVNEYFNISSSLKPLLHLWSLSIEEQFYLIFPFILFICFRKKLKYISILFIFCIISFLAGIDSVKYNFYSPLSRTWELFIGAIVCLLMRTNNKYILFIVFKLDKCILKLFSSSQRPNDCIVLKQIISIIGFSLIIYSLYMIKFNISYSSKNILPLIFGTCFIIVSNKTSLINKYILSNKFMVYIGVISYPLYLWHWSLLSYAHIIDGGLSGAQGWRLFRIICIIISIVLSIFTYHIIEKYFRFNNNHLKLKLITLILTTIAIGLCGIYINLKNGNINFTNNISHKILDRHKFRFYITKIARNITLFNTITSIQVLKGKNNWLYLNSDNLKSKLEGTSTLLNHNASDIFVSNIIDLFHTIDIDEKQKIIFIAPNKSTIYPEYLPNNIKISPDRYINYALQVLTDNNINIYDPTTLLQDYKKNNNKLLYYRTDSHWNYYGAYLSFIGFLDYIKSDNNIRHILDNNILFKDGPPFKGDLIELGNLDIQPVSGDNILPVWRSEPLNFISTDYAGNETQLNFLSQMPWFDPSKYITVKNNKAINNKIVWFFQDSFGHYLSPYLHVTYREVIHMAKVIKFIPQSISKPDIVIFEAVERHF